VKYLHAFRTAIGMAFIACLGVGAMPAMAQYTEVLANADVIGDVEFDWGRDGLPCPTCNFDDGNMRYNWTDRNNNLWVGYINPATGVFSSTQTLVDTQAYFWEDWGNGPEWAFSTQNGVVASQLVYTRFPVGDPATAPYAGAAFATMVDGAWQAGFLPGAIGAYNGTGANNFVLPLASQCNTDPVAMVLFQNLAATQEMFTMPVSSAAGTTMTETPFGPYANGIGERWVPCTTWLTFQGNAPPGPQGNIIQQVFWYNTATQVVQQLTTDPTAKQRATMFKAPDFGDNYVLMALSAGEYIQVLEVTGWQSNGAPILTLVNTIASPEPAEPYIFDPKVFINCSPTCQTYVVYAITSEQSSQNGITTPNGMAVATLNPAAPYNVMLASGLSGTPYQRLDPKYYITENGPYVYYDKIEVESAKTTYSNEGIWFINMNLGAPSGPCVGSSAEGGNAPGC
jgi:hypothetical protein